MTNSGDQVTRANNEANITAIATWKEMADREREDKLEAIRRADKFAVDRAEALAQVNEMKGRLSAMTETITAQAAELGVLREQVRQLMEQVHALRSSI